MKNLSDVEHMFLGGAGEDKDVINVDKDEPVQHVTENIMRPNGQTKYLSWLLAVLKAVFHSSSSRICTR